LFVSKGYIKFVFNLGLKNEACVYLHKI